MLVTQRGLLYALPAGLLLLCHWRRKYFSQRVDAAGKQPTEAAPALLPFWLELLLYATMPLFHMHTFIALSLIAAFFFLIGDAGTRKRLLIVVGGALLPATFFVYTITDRFRARSMIEWEPAGCKAKATSRRRSSSFGS
jgi:hypothetical protein